MEQQEKNDGLGPQAEKAREGQGPGFSRARTKEQIESRKKEIIDACTALYEKGGFYAVNFKAISETTSFTRQTIYQYYHTKEEILLDVLRSDQEKWIAYVKDVLKTYPAMSKEDYALFLTSSFAGHGIMLELTSLLFNVIEGKCSFEKLVEFRRASADIYHLLLVSVAKYFPTLSTQNHNIFTSTVFAYAVGLYSFSRMSPRQLEAERVADAYYVYPQNHNPKTAFETNFYYGILSMLSGMELMDTE